MPLFFSNCGYQVMNDLVETESFMNAKNGTLGTLMFNECEYAYLLYMPRGTRVFSYILMHIRN